MTDYARFQWGAVQYPLPASTAQSLLQDADPAIFEALAFFTGVLLLHAGARWDAECTALGLTDLVGKIVATQVPYDPVPVFQEGQFKPPILAIYRTKSVTKQRTVERDHEVTQWGLDWILPPLGPAELERLYPFLKAASVIISDRTDYGYDPNYQAGRLCWNLAGIEEIGVNNTEYTWLQNRGPGAQSGVVNQAFPVLHMDLEVSEQRALPASLFDQLAGVDTGVQSSSQPDPTPIDVANTSFNSP